MKPELVSYLEGLPEPHILFDPSTASRRPMPPTAASSAPRPRWWAAPATRSRTTSTCPATRPARAARWRARLSGQRERVLHLHHTPQGEAYVNIELVPLRDAEGRLAWFIEKMEPLRVAQRRAGRAGPDRPCTGLPADAGTGGACRPLRGQRAAAGRIGHRQGTGGARRARSQPARLAAAGGGGLREPARDAVRERALRPREGRLHRRHAAKPGLVEAARRHAVSRRGGRHPAGHAGQAAAPAGERHLPPRGQHGTAPHRRARGVGHAPRPAGHGRAGAFPAGPVLPAEHLPDPRCRPCASAVRRHALLVEALLSRVAPRRQLSPAPAALRRLHAARLPWQRARAAQRAGACGCRCRQRVGCRYRCRC
jgi:hypothetical protein